MRRHRISIVKKLSFLGIIIGLLYLCLQAIIYNIYAIVPLNNHEKDSYKTSDIHLELVSVPAKGLPEGQMQDLENTLKSNHNDSDYIDWHDYEQIEMESKRTGPGEQGKAVVLSDEEMVRDKETFAEDGFSGVSSDKMSLDRAVNDLRLAGCKSKKYLKNLPRVSVIIIFIDEYWTTLLRTVHSVVNRSPKSLLQEIVLVDDFSSREYLKQNLDDYMKKTFGKLVRILRNSKREGLIRTRLYGAREAKSDVFVFLESHVEVYVTWLPPLLEPVAIKNRTCACPTIDQIRNQDFQIVTQDQGARGGFDWRLEYKRFSRLKYSTDHPTEPFANPVMSGGLFAISKAFFWELGGYDAGLDIWGAEQYELSFKIWQCHGEMVDVPCSRVAHVYRGQRKESPHRDFGNFLSRNLKRVAVVWMDEYAEYVYQRWSSVRNIDPGDVTEMVELRKRLQCKPFKWFLEEVAFDIIPKYPPIEPPPYASGQIVNKNSSLCIDASYAPDNKPRMKSCLAESNHVQNTQEIRSCCSSFCLDTVGSEIIYTYCNSNDSQKWLLENFSLGAYKAIVESNSTSCS